jgi:hypothetical protein
MAYVCCVVRLLPLQGSLLIRISVASSDMYEGLFTAFKRKTPDVVMVRIVYTWMTLTIL